MYGLTSNHLKECPKCHKIFEWGNTCSSCETKLSEFNGLLVCPFCKKNDMLTVEKDEVGFYCVKCWMCGARGPAKNSINATEAAAHWQDRAD